MDYRAEQLRNPGVVLESWREEYNTEHLHSSLGYLTPAEFAAAQRRTPVLVPA